jgi:hypothetical protein
MISFESFPALDSQFIPVKFTGNGNIQSQLPAGGKTLPVGYSTISGIPFQLEATGKNFWCASLDSGTNPIVLTIPLEIDKAECVYTLINCYWGKPHDTTMGTIEFFGTNNASYKVKLIANENVRDFDYSPPAFADSIDNIYTHEVFNNKTGQRLDLQAFKLPECFAGQKLTSVRITDNGGSNIQRLFLYGITVQASVEKTSGDYSAIPFGYNGRLQSILHAGSGYPCGNLVLKGIPFQIPAAGPNWWHASNASGTNPKILNVDVNIYGASELYTLINLYWGVHGDSTKATVQCVGTKDSFSIALFTGRHLRDFDYLGTVYENNIDSGITEEVYNNGAGQRLDRQRLVLPSHFLNDTLKTIRFIDNGNENVQRIFLYGLTVKHQTVNKTFITSSTKNINLPEFSKNNTMFLLNGKKIRTQNEAFQTGAFQGYIQNEGIKIKTPR